MHKSEDWRERVYKTGEKDWNTIEWRNKRRECFSHDNYRCQRCERRFKSSLLTAHHIIPRSMGGPDLLHNLVTLCSPCHDFVEIACIYTLSGIVGSMDKPTTIEEDWDEDVDDSRPKWHKWVYGGVKRRM